MPGENAGSRFIIALPLRATPERDSGDGVAAGGPAVPVPDVPTLTGVTVLVVDDERDARDMLHAILAAAGASVIEASSVQEALGLLRGAAPDVLISDIGMAAEDGYAFIRQVRALPGELAAVPAVALTAYGRPADRAARPRGGVRPSRGEADPAAGARHPAHTLLGRPGSNH